MDEEFLYGYANHCITTYGSGTVEDPYISLQGILEQGFKGHPASSNVRKHNPRLEDDFLFEYSNRAWEGTPFHGDKYLIVFDPPKDQRFDTGDYMDRNEYGVGYSEPETIKEVHILLKNPGSLDAVMEKLYLYQSGLGSRLQKYSVSLVLHYHLDQRSYTLAKGF